jgi:predicted bacteriocin transport accessory protein
MLYLLRGENMKKLLLLISIVLLAVVGCSSSNLKEISYNKFKSMIDKKESFMVYIAQDGCSACATFSPKFKEVLKEHNITAYYINLTNLSSDDASALNEIVSFSGTPTVAFINKGVDEGILTHIADGNISKDEIIDRLKTFEYIK